MFNSNLKRVMKLFVTFIAIQWLGFTFAAPMTDLSTNVTPSSSDYRTELNSLVPRESDNVEIRDHWSKSIELFFGILAGAGTMGIFGNGVTTNLLTWKYNQPDAEKKCGKATLATITGEDNVKYRYYAYSYTTGDNCDTTQRAKTIVNALSDAMDTLHAENAYAACITIDHGGTWHGVLGIAIEGSDKDPQDVCSDVKADSKKRSISTGPTSFQLEGRDSEERNTTALVKRTAISVDVNNKKSGATKFSDPNKSVLAILDLAFQVYMQSSVYKTCSAVTGRVTAEDGITYNYFYEATGRNCDTTAQYKTVVSAIDDAWDGIGSYSAVCMKMDHKGTWKGYLGISAMQSDYPVQNLCSID